MKIKINTLSKTILADKLTPTLIYSILRENFEKCILLETTIPSNQESNISIICAKPIESFLINNGTIDSTIELSSKSCPIESLTEFINAFEFSNDNKLHNGFFGFMGFDAVQYFDDFSSYTNPIKTEIPDIIYSLYKFILVYNHKNSTLSIIQNYKDVQENQINTITNLLKKAPSTTNYFKTTSPIISPITDNEYKTIVEKGIKHCRLGDVFQIVLSRSYSANYTGDEFNVYRHLRSINPSPYMFYFDMGNYTLFGSSPESMLTIKDNKAIINPIAGTRKKTGDKIKDNALAIELKADPKENSEHVMLVDLARNDMSKNSNNVNVDTYAELHKYSHVMHLVSKVSGELNNGTNPLKVLADVFPAGTLSGAPKHRAIELINKYECHRRGYYGGCIGYINTKLEIDQAIIIRSFLAQNNVIKFQAGAGIVEKSNPDHELLEINNKLAALNQALINASQNII